MDQALFSTRRDNTPTEGAPIERINFAECPLWVISGQTIAG
jgi:hypothetical protein